MDMDKGIICSVIIWQLKCWKRKCFTCLLFFRKISYIFWLLLELFGTASQKYLSSCILGYSPHWGHWIKHNSQLLGCNFFQLTLTFLLRIFSSLFILSTNLWCSFFVCDVYCFSFRVKLADLRLKKYVLLFYFWAEFVKNLD